MTGGAQMDELFTHFTELYDRAGVPPRTHIRKKAVELPGFFRPTKNGDLLIVAAIKRWLPTIEAELRSAFLRQQYSTTGQRKRWAAPFIFGSAFENAPTSIARTILDISLCGGLR